VLFKRYEAHFEVTAICVFVQNLYGGHYLADLPHLCPPLFLFDCFLTYICVIHVQSPRRPKTGARQENVNADAIQQTQDE